MQLSNCNQSIHLQTRNTNSTLQSALNNRHLSFMVLAFLDHNDLSSLLLAVRSFDLKISQQTVDLITSFLFHLQYVNKVDRTIAYFMYENQLVKQIDNHSVLNIASNFATQANKIMCSFQTLFECLNKRCHMNQQEVDSLRRITFQPDLPLPLTIRSKIGKYCSSNFQLFVCSKITKNSSLICQESQFQQFNNHILENEDNYLVDILKSKNKIGSFYSIFKEIKDLYSNPQEFIERLSIDGDGLTEENHLFNFFIVMGRIAKTMISVIKLRLQSVQNDPYVYFTELLTRYSLYKNSMLELEESFGQTFESFELIVRQALGVNHIENQVNELSLWKVMQSVFKNGLKKQIQSVIPIYLNLIHKYKITSKNQIYTKLGLDEQQNLCEQSQQHDSSPVLEYMLKQSNIDNIQTFLYDFVEMLIDFEVDEHNVLLCGHSQHFLGGLFAEWEDAFKAYQTESFQKLNNIDEQNGEHHQKMIEKEMEFISKNLNIKPRTIKTMLHQINFETVSFKFQPVDRELIEVNRRYFSESFELNSSQKTIQSSLTADSDNNTNEMDLQGLEYFSEIDQEQSIEEIQI